MPKACKTVENKESRKMDKRVPIKIFVIKGVQPGCSCFGASLFFLPYQW